MLVSWLTELGIDASSEDASSTEYFAKLKAVADQMAAEQENNKKLQWLADHTDEWTDHADAHENFALGMQFYKADAAKNKAEILRLLKLASKQGSAPAQFFLGVLYHGQGESAACVVEKDIDEAVRYYELAAAQDPVANDAHTQDAHRLVT